MQFFRVVLLVILTEIRFRWILLRNARLIYELKQLSKQDPKLVISLKMSETHPNKIDYDMDYLD